MNREATVLNQLIAGSLLIFDKVDNLDLSLLWYELEQDEDIHIEGEAISDIEKYINIENGVISLKEGLTLDTHVGNSFTLGEKLTQIAGPTVSDYCSGLDVEGFTLLKLSQYDNVPVNDLSIMFNSTEIKAIDQLLDSYHLIASWCDNVVYDDYQIISLTFLGKQKLFIYENKKQVEKFKSVLKSMRYDEELLDDFLKAQNLEQTPDQILTLDNFINFCYQYDRCPTKEGATSVRFEKLGNSKDGILDEYGKKQMNEMLSIWDEGHCVYVCHPNDLFVPELITCDNKEIRNINWEDIDVFEMLTVGNYQLFYLPKCSDDFESVLNHLQCDMKISSKNEDNTVVSYLAVVEKYNYNGEDNYLVRGIIRGDNEGYSLAFNPEYQKAIPMSAPDKSQRACGCKTPNVYMKRRWK